MALCFKTTVISAMNFTQSCFLDPCYDKPVKIPSPIHHHPQLLLQVLLGRLLLKSVLLIIINLKSYFFGKAISYSKLKQIYTIISPGIRV